MVYDAQEAGIAKAVIGNNGRTTYDAAMKVINEGLLKLGIIKTIDEKHISNGLLLPTCEI